MLDIDLYPKLLWDNNIANKTSTKNLTNIIRQNDKILIEAQDRTYDYTMKRNRIGWTFESLLRSAGLAIGTLVCGSSGAATMGSIFSGVGRGIGEFLGNKVYGKALHDLDEISEDYKYRQLSNEYTISMNKGTGSMIEELYKQTLEAEQTTVQELSS